MRGLLGFGLLVLQSGLLIPLIVHLRRSSASDGVSLLGESVWAVAGIGWAWWAVLANDPAVLISGLLGSCGGVSLLVLAVRRAPSGLPPRVAVLSCMWGAVMIVAGVWWSAGGLSLVLSVFGSVQFFPYFAASWRVFRGGSGAGVSVAGSALRSGYTGLWALYGLGWVLWGAGAGPVAWPLVAWGGPLVVWRSRLRRVRFVDGLVVLIGSSRCAVVVGCRFP